MSPEESGSPGELGPSPDALRTFRIASTCSAFRLGLMRSRSEGRNFASEFALRRLRLSAIVTPVASTRHTLVSPSAAAAAAAMAVAAVAASGTSLSAAAAREVALITAATAAAKADPCARNVTSLQQASPLVVCVRKAVRANDIACRGCGFSSQRTCTSAPLLNVSLPSWRVKLFLLSSSSFFLNPSPMHSKIAFGVLASLTHPINSSIALETFRAAGSCPLPVANRTRTMSPYKSAGRFSSAPGTARVNKTVLLAFVFFETVTVT
mmetsp:Transcript_46233/g.106757  ORF Transcript_46233/g.106757 Transcript_46233/m.106757 type:complete len:266 (+) Transcript_46233:459-1256(+)